MLFTVVKTLESKFAECISFCQGAAHRDTLLATVTNRSHCGTKGDLPIQGGGVNRTNKLHYMKDK